VKARTVVILAALAGVALWFLYGDSEEGGVVGDVRQMFLDAVSGVVRGARVTRCPYDKTTGVAPCDPHQLAAQAGVDDETYALARGISSEEGTSGASTKAAVAWAIKNEAARRGSSIFALVTHAKLAAHSGFYGTQRNIEEGTAGYNGSDRFISTAQDPYDGDITIASGVLDGTIPDVTGGANQFDRPSGEANPDQVAANRVAAGSEQVQGISDLVDGDLRFWRVVGVS
jgi:hypothetical protein